MCWLAYFVLRLYDWWTRAVSGVGVQVIAGSHVCNRPLLIGRIEKLSGVQGSLPFPVDLLLLRATHVDGERPAATGVSPSHPFGGTTSPRWQRSVVSSREEVQMKEEKP
jgi:hypothetical protein